MADVIFRDLENVLDYSHYNYTYLLDTETSRLAPPTFVEFNVKEEDLRVFIKYKLDKDKKYVENIFKDFLSNKGIEFKDDADYVTKKIFEFINNIDYPKSERELLAANLTKDIQDFQTVKITIFSPVSDQNNTTSNISNTTNTNTQQNTNQGNVEKVTFQITKKQLEYIKIILAILVIALILRKL
ncbi:MAG: hypothetical protein KatS3mg096_590 [Candidatus Parcubacteria bacterium]|nr:MAG: hypothetical protein KatS3mg096_590 [Candidatus Parcubacteria bacterium]